MGPVLTDKQSKPAPAVTTATFPMGVKTAKREGAPVQGAQAADLISAALVEEPVTRGHVAGNDTAPEAFAAWIETERPMPAAGNKSAGFPYPLLVTDSLRSKQFGRHHKVGWVASLLMHLAALAAAGQWTATHRRWSMEVDRGAAATLAFTASVAPAAPDESFFELSEPDPPSPLAPAERDAPLPDQHHRQAMSSAQPSPIVAPTAAPEPLRRDWERVGHTDAQPEVAFPTATPPRKRQRSIEALAAVVIPPVTERTNDRAGAQFDTPPRKLPRNPPPSYPEAARRAGQEGRVALLVQIDHSGQVVHVAVHRSSGVPELDQEAVRTVSRWRFQPAVGDGKPVASEIIVPIRFSLRAPN